VLIIAVIFRGLTRLPQTSRSLGDA